MMAGLAAVFLNGQILKVANWVLAFLAVGCFWPAKPEPRTRTRVARKEDMAMRDTKDTTPLVRSTIGFDRLLEQLETLADLEPGDNYPPYNIEKVGEDRYRIALAVAGFSDHDLEITAEANLLTVAGKKTDAMERQILYRGIAHRPFTRRFRLAEFVVVTAAKLTNGLLTIELERQLPEAMKPRHILINGDMPAIQTRRAA